MQPKGIIVTIRIGGEELLCIEKKELPYVPFPSTHVFIVPPLLHGA